MTEVSNRLKRARTRVEIEGVLDDLEDRYDAFSGPGQEWADGLLELARQRLQEWDRT